MVSNERNRKRGSNQLVDASATDQFLFKFLVLVTDIKYRNKFLKSFDYNSQENYNENQNEVLADQISPVDKRSARL